MRFSVITIVGFVALAVAQAPPSAKPSFGAGPPGGAGGPKGPGGPKGAGGPKGPGGPGGAGGPPGGKGKGKGDGKGGAGFAKLSCAAKCLQPIKDSGCKFPIPKKGDGSGPPSPGGPPPKGPSPVKGVKSNHVARQAPPGGPPAGADGARPPMPKIDPEAVKQFQTCLCTNKAILDSIQTCVPSACTGEGESPAPIFKMYNGLCKSVDSFKPLEIPGGGPPAAGGAPPAPKPSPPKAPAPKAAVVMSEA